MIIENRAGPDAGVIISRKAAENVGIHRRLGQPLTYLTGGVSKDRLDLCGTEVAPLRRDLPGVDMRRSQSDFRRMLATILRSRKSDLPAHIVSQDT